MSDVRRNRGPRARLVLTEEHLNRAALEDARRLGAERAVALADESALLHERGVGGAPPPRATPDGIVCEDFQHLLLEGVRAYGSVVDGVVLYDPVGDVAVVVQPDGREARVTAGGLDVIDRLKETGVGAWAAVLAAACERVAWSYDEDREQVSRWLLRRAAEAALLVGPQRLNPQWRSVVPRHPEAIWRELGRHWIWQPWGLGRSPLELGEWTS